MPDSAVILCRARYVPDGHVTLGAALYRPARVVLPANYNDRSAWPVVMVLHGYNSSGKCIVPSFPTPLLLPQSPSRLTHRVPCRGHSKLPRLLPR